MPPQLQIYVAGAGLGGLSAAIACSMAGHQVTILERSPVLAEIGAGLQMGPNGTRILQEYGLGRQLEECAAEPEAYIIQRYFDGKVLHQSPDWGRHMQETFGAPFLDVHRGQLQRIMYERALELGTVVLLDSTIKSVNATTGMIILESGKTYKGDLLVGADGLWSICRAALLGHDSPPRATGDLAYRIVMDPDRLEDETLRSMITKPCCRLWIGPESHVVAYSLKGGREFNIVLLVPDDLPSKVAKQEGNVEEMRALFRSWDPILTKFLDKVEQVQKWKLMHLKPLETWRNESGNFVLIGDSCHPMLPYLGQGASSAIEDGAVLGKLLEHVTSPAQVPQVTASWQSLRKARNEYLVREASAQRDQFHMRDGPEQEARDRVFEQYRHSTPCEGYPSRWADPKVQEYIFNYRALEEASTAARVAVS